MSIETFLRQRAVDIGASGNYTIANWYDPEGKPRSFACRTKRVSPFRMLVDVPVVGRLGDAVSSYFSDFGNLNGVITDTASGVHLLELHMTRAQRERMSNQLTWLERRQKDPNVPDARMDARIIPANPHSTLTFADGSVYSCFVIDMSVSGVAVSAEPQPLIGTALAVGACVGRVVRSLPNGFAVQFAERQKRTDLDWLIGCQAPLTRGPQLTPEISEPPPVASAQRNAVEYLEI